MYLFSSKIKENRCSPITIELRSHLTQENMEFMYTFLKNICFIIHHRRNPTVWKEKALVKHIFLLVIVSNATPGNSVFCKTFDDWKVLTSLMYIQVHRLNLKWTFSNGASGCTIANANTVNFPLQTTKYSSSPRNKGVQNFSKVTNNKTETPFLYR